MLGLLAEAVAILRYAGGAAAGGATGEGHPSGQVGEGRMWGEWCCEAGGQELGRGGCAEIVSGVGLLAV